MLNLILKDLLMQKRERTVVIAIILGIVGAFTLRNNLGFGLGQMFMVVYLFTGYANAFDYKYNGETILNSLPLSRWQIVVAKYLSVFVFLAVAVACTLIPALVLTSTRLGFPEVLNLQSIALVFSAVCLYYSFYYPIYFRFGYAKSRWANFLTLTLVMILAGMVGSLDRFQGRDLGDDVPPQVQNALASLGEVMNTGFLPILLGISLAVLAVSTAVSVRIYDRKEF